MKRNLEDLGDLISKTKEYKDAHRKPKKRTGPTPEGAASEVCIEYLVQAMRAQGFRGKIHRKNTGVMVHKYDNGKKGYTRFGETGQSDYEVELEGTTQMIFMEVKRPAIKHLKQTAGKLSHEQANYLIRRRAQGHIGIAAACPWDIYLTLKQAGWDRIPVPERPAEWKAVQVETS